MAGQLSDFITPGAGDNDDGAKLTNDGTDVRGAGGEVGPNNTGSINGGPGDGTGKRDVLRGDNDGNTIKAGPARDLANGGPGDDKVFGQGGNDAVLGGSGNDTVDGGDGNDIVAGNSGDDLLKGGKGDDTLVGGTGDDEIRGGKGEDVMFGGAGEDTFVIKAGRDFGGKSTGDDAVRDTIADFELGTDILEIAGPKKFTYAISNEGDDLLMEIFGAGGNLRGEILFTDLADQVQAGTDLSLLDVRALFNEVVVAEAGSGKDKEQTIDGFDFDTGVVDIQGPSRFDYKGEVEDDTYVLQAFGNGENLVNTITFTNYEGTPGEFDLVNGDGIGTEAIAENEILFG